MSSPRNQWTRRLINIVVHWQPIEYLRLRHLNSPITFYYRSYRIYRDLQARIYEGNSRCCQYAASKTAESWRRVLQNQVLMSVKQYRFVSKKSIEIFELGRVMTDTKNTITATQRNSIILSPYRNFITAVFSHRRCLLKSHQPSV